MSHRVFVCNLERKELSVAAMTGVMRYIENVYAQKPQKYGTPRRSWDIDIYAAIGEMVVARLLNEYWCPGTWGTPDLPKRLIEVRSTGWKNGKLILHPEDADDCPFVLVTIDGSVARLPGWIYGRDGKNQRWWQTEGSRQALQYPCFMVPQHELRPIEDLLLILKQQQEDIS